ncbi:MAG: hypothetical protein ABSC57_11400 [Syntrophales bacterium]
MEEWKSGRMEKPLRVAEGSFLPSREKRSGCKFVCLSAYQPVIQSVEGIMEGQGLIDSRF